MRSLHTLLILLAVAPVGAAQVYRWVDKDGVVHFSDQPVKGAEQIPLTPAPKPGSVAPPAYRPPPAQLTPPPETVARYNRCVVKGPTPDQTFMQADVIAVQVDTDPALQPEDGIAASLNGEALQGWPRGSAAFRIGPLPRGAYTLAVTVTGADGTVKCTSPTTSFNVFQPTLLSPARKPKPR